ncbi:hypothetical protein Tco_1114793 [Tanacetum coccineum]
MGPAPDPSRHDDQSVNRFHSSGIASSAGASIGGPSSSGLPAIKSAKIWPRIDDLFDGLVRDYHHWRYIISSSLGFGAVSIGSSAIHFFIFWNALFAFGVMECFFDVPEYFMLCVDLYYKVIYIYLLVPANLFFKCLIHESLSSILPFSGRLSPIVTVYLGYSRWIATSGVCTSEEP